MENKFKYCFLGTPSLCLPILESLKTNFGLPEFIITNPAKPVGRKKVITASPVYEWAKLNNVLTFTPSKINKEFYLELPATDLAIVVAYGQILPENFINYPKFGTINLHYSLLPLYRGASPIEAAILSGDKETGVTVQKMVKELDAGPIILQQKHTLNGTETGISLENDLNKIGAELLIQSINLIIKNNLITIPQDESLATFCRKIKKEDSQLLETDSDIIKWRKYRAYQGWPRVFYFDQDGKRVIISQADFANDKFIIKKVIKEGESEKNYSSN